MKKGLVHVYTGDGKGKTTAAFGLVLRALGRGLSVCVIQFMKGQESGEVLALKKFSNAAVKQFGRESFVNFKNPSEEDKHLAQEGIEFAKEVVYEEKYDLVILDEINLAVWAELVMLEDVLEILENKPPSIELVLTGRPAILDFIEAANYVTDFGKIKHPFDEGEKAREGVEF